MNNISHKDIAVNFLKLISEGEIRPAFDKYIAQSFFHHNPHFKGDREGLAQAMEASHATVPNKIYEVKHAVEEGDLVVVHGSVQLVEKGVTAAVIHICRFEDNKIVEMWDVAEEIPKNSPNENGMF